MKLIAVLTIFMLIASCNGGKLKRKNNLVSNSQASLFNLALFFSESEQNLSFPIWFNDSILKSKGITEITRCIYDDTTEFPENQFLKKRFIYKFSNKGNLISMDVSNHYDNKIISSVKIFFESFDQKSGYSKTVVNDNSDYNHEEFPFIRYAPAQKSEHYSSFKDLESPKTIFIVPSEKNWKALVIDTLCQPEEIDLIIYGSYRVPQKRYQVKNLVEEFNVRNYSYNGTNLSEINWKDDPFKIKRRFKYSKDGQCVGFIESTFGMEKYVSAIHYDFELKENLPEKVVKKLFRDTNKIVLSVETYVYK